ncbi:NAD(P)/FAD-dependent oxidoreductase [Glutamicibacter sp.]|uniref:phytoene desaturase family protein n=1 Tax=Glutamicibacter sp. TaxID=1931995 RepID=UPI0028BEFCCE|nr:NAD(P)/FAD-dependent oxidoreductase [Glutamicibacter sp.]
MSSVAVVGAGPNGLTAAAVAARAGLNVTVYEANEAIGGAARTQPLDGSAASFDLGSAVHPMALQSTAFAELGVLDKVDFIIPELSFAHVIDQRRTAYAWKDLDRTGEVLGPGDGAVYTRLLGPLVRRMDELSGTLLSPLLKVPSHPATLAAFGAATVAGMGLKDLASTRFAKAAALYSGCAAHVAGGQRGPANAGAGLFLAAAAHSRGWPIPRGGSQAISNALAEETTSRGGVIRTGVRIESLDELAEETVLLDTSAETAARIAGPRIPDKLSAALHGVRRSPGSCVVHFVLGAPVPWRDPVLARTGTVHLGGTAGTIGRAERLARTATPQEPFVILSQPSLFDDSRAPAGQQVVWAYCHVPLHSSADMQQEISSMIEAAAPGFRDLILESHVVSAQGLERQNAALVGGDISGGSMDLLGSVRRPVLSRDPWYLRSKGLYLISSAVPPGPSVHGMGGYLGALSMLRREYGVRQTPA